MIKEIRKELKKHYDSGYQKGCQNFFKEDVLVFGVRTPIVRKVSSLFFKKVKDRPKEEVFNLAEELIKEEYLEFKTIGFDWVYRLRKQFEKKDFKFFEKIIQKYIKNWASCDDFCTHTIGYFITTFPLFIPELKKWAVSKNMWMRRAAAVSFITSSSTYTVSHNLKDIFDIAKILMYDKEDLVQKGYGWMLKAASNKYPKEVFEFVLKWKDIMPRTALRYAIEKYPQGMRKKAMS